MTFMIQRNKKEGKLRVLVFGASGMLGSSMMRILSENGDLQVYGTVRSNEAKSFFTPRIAQHLLNCTDVTNLEELGNIFSNFCPDVVINCISLSKPLLSVADPLLMIPVYALLPHQLAKLCSESGARLIHISSDGVFSGVKGGYTEEDPADTKDLYGLTKYIGEVDSPSAITIRTSMIGHELQGSSGLLGWFLSQENRCECYSRAIFSGLPTVVIAQIVRDIVIPQAGLYGIYHIAANPISKCDLLKLVAEVYNKTIEIIPNDSVVIDRSLNTDRFRQATGYVSPDWLELIKIMYLSQHNSLGLTNNV